MRRCRLALVTLLVCILFTVSAQAIEPRAVRGIPSLVFNGTTAQCSALCNGGSSSDTVEATLTLYQGTTYIDSWSDSGKDSLSFSGSCKVERGKTYKLVLSYSINGVEKPSVTVTNTCR